MDVVTLETLVLSLAVVVVVMVGVVWFGASYVRSAHKRVDRLDSHLHVIVKRLNQAKTQVDDSDEQQTAYQRAQAMIVKQVPLEQVVSTCNISKAEAELLKLMVTQVQNSPNQDQD